MARFDVFKGAGGIKLQSQVKKKTASGFSATHPINNVKNNDILVEHIKSRLDFAKPVRDEFVLRLATIDRQVAGYVKLTKEERKAELDTQKGDPKPGKMNIQLVFAQLDETATFLMGVFAPDSSLYEALADKEDQSAANSFVLLMNKNAEIMGYYRNYYKAIWDSLKYNLGGLSVSWAKIVGPKVARSADGGLNVEQNTSLWEGNKVRTVDLYNCFWDISVHPVDIPLNGEFVAEVFVHTEFAIRRMEANKEIHGIDKFISQQNLERLWYKSPPDIRPPILTGSTTNEETASGTFDWVSLLSQGTTSSGVEKAIELVNYIGWLTPSKFGLSSSTELQIWRITMAANKFIVATEHLNYAHGRLPYSFAAPMEDGLGLQNKSLAEILSPLQTFGSFLINTHMAANRKSLFGIQTYDPSILPLGDVGDDVNARIPVNPAGYGKDIRNAFTSFNDAPDTGNTMADLGKVIELMQYLLPTDQQKQVADLDRATQYHAAATVQGGNRRHLRVARMLNDQMFVNVRLQQLYNVIQFQPTIELTLPDGTKKEISPKTFSELDFEFIIAEGLQQIDKLQLILNLKEIINTIIQSQQALQEIDIVGLLNYWSSLQGGKIDLTRFRRPPPTVNPETGEPLPNVAPAQADQAAQGA